MANETLLEPIAGADPCGEDLQWDPDFMVAGQMLENLGQLDGDGVVDGEAVEGAPDLDDLDKRITLLCGRTRDLRLMAMRAELCWRRDGLPGFAAAMEDLVALAERWPGPDDGCHPRADPDDGSLGERAAALGKLLNRAPGLAATIGWGVEPNMQQRQDTAAALRGVFDAWTARLEGPFGGETPSRNAAWEPVRALLGGTEAVAAADGDETAETFAAAAPADAWDLVQRAAEAMAVQDRHSPALPVLRLLLGWRAKDIIEIADAQRDSGVTLEQLLDSVRNQLAPP